MLHHHNSSPKWLIATVLTFTMVVSMHKHFQAAVPTNYNNDSNNRIWISMAVCWSGNTKFYNKQNFPYRTAAALSSKLWRLETPHSVIVQVVYESPQSADDRSKMLKYINDLREAGAEIVEAVPTANMSCSLKAQLQRMFAYKLVTDKEDILVTADVDTFVMDKNIFQDIIEFPRKKIWLFQYQEVLQFAFTFNMNFIAMKASLWKEIFGGVDTPEELVQKYKVPMALKEDLTMWDYDQKIVTRAILESQICTIPKDNQLWTKLKMTPPMNDVNDTETCFKGRDKWLDCNIKRTSIEGGCKRWHFHVHERKNDLIKKYREISQKFINHHPK